jgi:hypothetical protein
MSNNVFGRRGTTVPVCAYVDGHDRQVDVIEQLIVELDGHAGGEEHHRVGQRNPEDSPGTEKERTKGNQSSPVR